jgi:hypothetical protein
MRAASHELERSSLPPLPRSSGASGHEHNLAAGMTPREIPIGIAHIGQTIDLGDRDLEAASIDQASKFRKHLGIRRRGIPRRLDAVFRGRREVDDRIDPIGRDAEFERKVHIAAAESVDEGIDLVSRCGSDPVRNAFPISNRDHTMVGKPGMVCSAGKTDDLGADIPRQLHGDRAHAADGARDDDGIGCLQRNGLHRRISCGSRDEQSPCLLPRDMGGSSLRKARRI